MSLRHLFLFKEPLGLGGLLQKWEIALGRGTGKPSPVGDLGRVLGQGRPQNLEAEW